jgi:hypothetical protein
MTSLFQIVESKHQKERGFRHIRQLGSNRGQPLAGMFNVSIDKTLLSCQRVPFPCRFAGFGIHIPLGRTDRTYQCQILTSVSLSSHPYSN